MSPPARCLRGIAPVRRRMTPFGSPGYDHLAGRAGFAVADAFVAMGHICSPMKAMRQRYGRTVPMLVRRRPVAGLTKSTTVQSTLSRLKRTALSHQWCAQLVQTHSWNPRPCRRAEDLDCPTSSALNSTMKPPGPQSCNKRRNLRRNRAKALPACEQEVSSSPVRISATSADQLSGRI